MRTLSAALLMAAALLTANTCAQEKPVSLVLNGGFERSGGWTKPTAASFVDSGRTGRCLRLDGQGGATQEVLVEDGQQTFSCSVEVKTENIQAVEGRGYAYAAVYQLNSRGKWVAFKDFAIIEDAQDWTRHDFTFTLAPGVEMISLRCGIYNAGGTAWFDNWTLVEGETAYAFADVSTLGGGTRPDQSVAVFREDDFPAKGVASSPDRIGRLLTDAGMTVAYLTADQLASSRAFNPALFSLVVLPYGQSFPAEARANMFAFLRGGGSFISTGGYAFESLLLKRNGEWVDEKVALEEALREASKHSDLPDGGFEASADAPTGGTELDGRWRKTGEGCSLVEESPKEGKVCAKIVVDPDHLAEDRWYADIAPERGERYRVSGWVKTEEVNPVGYGFAYLACYEYGDEDKLGEWKDFATVRGTNDWQQFTYYVSPAASTTRLHIKMGLYQATGTAWFDDIRLARVTGTGPRPMNTSTGDPQDGLRVAPSQIGVFDPSFPLRRATHAQPGAGQYLFTEGTQQEATLTGWAASGVQGYDNARWIPLLDARDRFGRTRGAAGALMINYNGFYGGSMWGYFGVESRDLFDGTEPALDRGLVSLAQFMTQGVFLHNLDTDLDSYKPGEPVARTVVVENYGAKPQSCRVDFAVISDREGATPTHQHSVEVTVPPGNSREIKSVAQVDPADGDTFKVIATLFLDGAPIDRMESGFIIQSDAAIAAGPELRFRDNYFTLNGRPMFLFGSDTYSYTYNSQFENPWTWHLDHVAARDFGFNVYENLQFSRPPEYKFTDADWRQFHGMAQSCQKHSLTFMPCQLVGHNVAISPDLLAKQSAQCTAYAENMLRYPGLLYYLNGDFRLRLDDKESIGALWNEWLADKYETAEALAASWGDEVYGAWGELPYPPAWRSQWDSALACDRVRFEVDLTRRWVSSHVDAVRSKDPDHPITSEYYRQPFGGMDLILTIDGQDASNIGYFDLPYDDVDKLPLALRLIDLRMRGKSLGLGEYGVKTHPAWTVDNGAVSYHIVRTEEEQKRLFMAVAHYGLGMGACKVQNWCLRDAGHSVFPWGVFYPNGRIPKDVAYWHRNLSLVWRHFTPTYVPPTTAVLIPDSLRLGHSAQAGLNAAYTAFRALMDIHVDFNCINEQHIEALSAQTETLIWPAPFCPDDAAYEKVLQWVRDGGGLIVSGDLSFNWDRKRTRTERLKELCGVEFVRELYRPPTRLAEGAQEARVAWRNETIKVKPCIEVKPAGAEVLSSTESGTPVRFLNKVGEGAVVFCTDPLELGDMDSVLPDLRRHYRSAMGPDTGDAGPQGPTGPMPDLQEDIDICRQPLATGGEFVTAFNTNMPPGAETVLLPAGDADVVVKVAARYPAFTATAGDQFLVAVGCSGEATFDSQPLVRGDAQVIYLSLDGRPLPISEGVLLCPFSSGSTQFITRRDWSEMAVVVGDIVDGKWVTYDTVDGSQGIDLTEDTMTCLMLICHKDLVDRFTDQIEQSIHHPDQMKGY